MTSQRGSRPLEAANLLRAGANTLDDPETGEGLDLMHFTECRSVTSNDGQVNFCEKGGPVSNGIQSRAFSNNQNLLCVDGRTLVERISRMIKSMNLKATNCRIPTVFSPSGKRNVSANGLSTPAQNAGLEFRRSSRICVVSPNRANAF
jgi:hypothetical protein